MSILSRKRIRMLAGLPAHDNAYGNIDAMVEQTVAKEKLDGASLVIFNKDGVVHEKHFGVFTGATKKCIGSGAKGISAGVFSALLSEGNAGFAEDTIPLANTTAFSSPNWQDSATSPGVDTMTLAHCMSFTGGLWGTEEVGGNFSCYNLNSTTIGLCANSEVVGYGMADFIADVGGDGGLYNVPGAEFRYAGTHQHILAVLAQTVFVSPWANLFDTRLRAPLGMHDTHYSATSATPNYDSTLTGLQTWTLEGDVVQPRIAGGVVTSALDYAKFLQMMLNDGKAPNGDVVIKPEFIAPMLVSQTGDSATGLPLNYSIRQADYDSGTLDEEYRYSRGMWYKEHEGNIYLSSEGAFGCIPWICPNLGYGGVLLLNQSSLNDETKALSNRIKFATSKAYAQGGNARTTTPYYRYGSIYSGDKTITAAWQYEKQATGVNANRANTTNATGQTVNIGWGDTPEEAQATKQTVTGIKDVIIPNTGAYIAWSGTGGTFLLEQSVIR